MIIYITSKRTKQKVSIGEIDFTSRKATFWITESRFFQEANCLGIDKKVFERKDMLYCDEIIFKLWNGQKYSLTKSEFAQHAWVYPPGDKKEYLANKSVFEPKYMIELAKIKEIIKNRKPKNEEEYLRELAQLGTFG